MSEPGSGARTARVTALADAISSERDDVVAEEEPLEIQVNGVSCAVVMRTPGHDEELALGFLVTERIVKRTADVVSLRHSSVAPEPHAEDNVLAVVLAPDVDPAFGRLRRNTFASASCGICGKATISAALASGGPVRSSLVVDVELLYEMPTRLRQQQSTFERTGGLHAAALFDDAGRLLVLREDVGRHNAVDKVIGWAAREGASAERLVLLVSGRISYEIVQKAAAFGVPIVAGISAPTSLAIEAAAALDVTVAGFLRGKTVNVYSAPRRIVCR
ncbi:MAG: formate dehydrogenase accessory sulfurtransferase FdhD [Polyangiaceae bacterium]